MVLLGSSGTLRRWGLAGSLQSVFLVHWSKVSGFQVPSAPTVMCCLTVDPKPRANHCELKVPNAHAK